MLRPKFFLSLQNWQWTFKNIRITNSRIGIDMSAEGNPVSSGVGSILLMDSTITNTQTGIRIRNNPPPTRTDVSGTLLLDNVQVTNVGTVVANIGTVDLFVHRNSDSEA